MSRRVSPPKPGSSAQVRTGDTLYRIATTHGVSPLDLAMWNRIPPPYTIYPGQRLRLTAPDPRRADPPPRIPGTPAPSKPPVTQPPIAQTPPRRPRRSRHNLPHRHRKPHSTGAGLQTGRLSSASPRGSHPAGVDIAGKSGSPVRAAADGVVVYSGAGLVGYGELINVKHSEQWLSAYGHNRAGLVNEGQRVKAGEQIADGPQRRLARHAAFRDSLQRQTAGSIAGIAQGVEDAARENPYGSAGRRDEVFDKFSAACRAFQLLVQVHFVQT